MLLTTLEKIAQGGIRDHLGGGFHRYSTDRYWRVPHFEKMLYDNGQLATVYAQAYELTPRDDFKRVVDETLDFVLREMTDPTGGFYAALDAETDAEEGRYYVWDREEIEQALSARGVRTLVADVYGIVGRAELRRAVHSAARRDRWPTRPRRPEAYRSGAGCEAAAHPPEAADGAQSARGR